MNAHKVRWTIAGGLFKGELIGAATDFEIVGIAQDGPSTVVIRYDVGRYGTVQRQVAIRSRDAPVLYAALTHIIEQRERWNTEQAEAQAKSEAEKDAFYRKLDGHERGTRLTDIELQAARELLGDLVLQDDYEREFSDVSTDCALVADWWEEPAECRAAWAHYRASELSYVGDDWITLCARCIRVIVQDHGELPEGMTRTVA